MRHIAIAMCLFFVSTSVYGAVEEPQFDLKLLPLKTEKKEVKKFELFSSVPSLPGKLFDLAKDTYVQGYFKNNGTYVQPHYRSTPDGSSYNNYSYPGNTNPYTGKAAPGNPFSYGNGNEYNSRSGSSLYNNSLNRSNSYGLGSPQSGLWGLGD